jgi:hypothetical protein
MHSECVAMAWKQCEAPEKARLVGCAYRTCKMAESGTSGFCDDGLDGLNVYARHCFGYTDDPVRLRCWGLR